jgi:hypothetical protein
MKGITLASPMNAILLLALLLPTLALGGPRTSANYTLGPEGFDAGGQRTAGANYTHDGSLGMICGMSTAPFPAETAKHGYVAQLYDVVGVEDSATPATVNETATRQLAAAQRMDDDSTLPLAAASVAWSVVTGPVVSVSTGGLATAGVVYQNTAATVRGTYGGMNGTLGLTVLNLLPDNFGSYAGDSIDDDWQVGYFGLDSPQAAPGANPDADPHNNRFEFLANLNPVDPNSCLHLTAARSPASPGGIDIVFWPVFAGRTYTVARSTTLDAGSWIPLASPPTSEAGGVRTVTDVSAAESREFYRVEITKP